MQDSALVGGRGQEGVCVCVCVCARLSLSLQVGHPTAPELAALQLLPTAPLPGLHWKVLPGVLPQFFLPPLLCDYSLFCSLGAGKGLEPSFPGVCAASTTQEEAS